MHGHQLDDVDTQLDQIVEPFDHPGKTAAEPLDVHLVDHREVVMKSKLILLWPRRGHHGSGSARGPGDTAGGWIDQRFAAIDADPVGRSQRRPQAAAPATIDHRQRDPFEVRTDLDGGRLRRVDR